MNRLRKQGIAMSLFLAAFLLLIWILIRLMDWGMCTYYGHQTGRDTRYTAFLGCLVRANNGWIPRNEIRVLQ